MSSVPIWARWAIGCAGVVLVVGIIALIWLARGVSNMDRPQ